MNHSSDSLIALIPLWGWRKGVEAALAVIHSTFEAGREVDIAAGPPQFISGAYAYASIDAFARVSAWSMMRSTCLNSVHATGMMAAA